VFAIYLVVFGTLSSSGLLEEKPMPYLMLFFLGNAICAIAFAFSPAGSWLAYGLPVQALVAFHSFRLPLELVLHEWAEQGTIPTTMTWTGQNFDIVSGALALLVTPALTRFQWLAWVFNIVGFLLLLNVIRVAVMSSPLPFSWNTNPPLQLAFNLPYALIGPVC